MKSRNRIWIFCAFVLVSALGAWAQEGVDAEGVRPSGVAGPDRKGKAVTARDREDADAEPTAARKTKASKSTHASSHRKRAKAKDIEESIPAPTEYTPDGIPKTSAASVIVVDANTGKILYEKNADRIRPAANTQKVLTALTVAVRGHFDTPGTGH